MRRIVEAHREALASEVLAVEVSCSQSEGDGERCAETDVEGEAVVLAVAQT